MKKFPLLALAAIFVLQAYAQDQPLAESRTTKSAGITLSPQMLFLGVLDAGIYGSIEYKPIPGNGLSLLAGLDVRNKLFQIRHQTVGLNTRGLKSHYDLNILFPVGMGYTFRSGKEARTESFYLTAAPNFFVFKESVNTEFFSNTVRRSNYQTLYGISWITTSTTKKGRIINTQLFVPLFHRSFLEVARNMNVKVGIGF